MMSRSSLLSIRMVVQRGAELFVTHDLHEDYCMPSCIHVYMPLFSYGRYIIYTTYYQMFCNNFTSRA